MARDSHPLSELHVAAAQLLTVGFFGTQLADPLRGLIDRGVAGVVLFSRNVESASQVGQLVRQIKEYAARPLIVAIDHEGGLVQRLRSGFTRVPSMRAVGLLGDDRLAEQLGYWMGTELRAVGIDMNYAPVLDVDSNPDNPVIGERSLGRDPDLVARLGVAVGRGIERAGVASCGKHFPGHGDTALDSHHQLPILPHGLARLNAVELVPFRAWAQAGLSAVMTAHVVFEALDGKYPATMSRPLLQGVLREELGFQGLVVTDDLEMRAIADHYGYEEAVVRGLNAGADQFLCCHTAEIAHSLVNTVVEAVESGRVDRGRLVDANRRASNFLARWVQPPVEARLEALCDPTFAQLVGQFNRDSVDAAAVDPTERAELRL